MTFSNIGGLALLLAAAALIPPSSLSAQNPPPPPDTIPADTVRADTIDADTVGVDTLDIEEALPPPRPLPELPTPLPVHVGTGVWEWDRDALFATRAVTLVELLSEIPGVVPLRGGDYGYPAAVSAFGVGGGRLRVFLDGFEMAPLEGGTVDLSRTGLGTLERVRVERHPGEIRIELTSLTILDSRPYTFIHAGTGDLNTNVLRGVFQHPRILGGNVAIGIDRLDTQGVNRQEPGSMSGGWFRYAYVPFDRAGLSFEFRRNGSTRGEILYPPGDLTRTDWMLRGRVRLADGVVADAFWGRSSLEEDSPPEEEGDAEESPPSLHFDSRGQLGLRLRIERRIPPALRLPLMYWAEGSARLNRGDGWADHVSEGRLGLRAPALGGVEASFEREGWPGGESASGVRLKAWTRPLLGLSLFGSWEDGRRGMPLPAIRFAGAERPATLFTDRSATRLGASFDFGALSVSGARIEMEADRLAPFGFAAERPAEEVGDGERPRDGLVLPAGRRTGFEVTGNVPLLVLDGLSLSGSGHFWDADAVWRYLPRRSYEARLAFHDVFLPTGNLEVWVDAGVRGRDPMALPLPGDPNPWLPTEQAVVPFDQSWFARLQIRVVTVRVFVDWENFTIRRANQDFPGRLMPATRTMYGVRWTLWN